MRIIAYLFLISVLALIITTNLGWTMPILNFLKSQFFFYDKVGHFIIYGSLAFFVNILFNGQKVAFFSWPLLFGSLLVGLGITLEECSQILLPNRNFEMLDLVCNYAGIICFSYLFPIFVRTRVQHNLSSLSNFLSLKISVR